MKLDLTKENKELISIVLCGISILIAVVISMKVISYYKLTNKAESVVDIAQSIITNDSNKPEDIANYIKPSKEIADNLKKSNLFAPPAPKTNPVTQIQCILGDEAFINNKWYKQGAMIQDAKVVLIEPTQVTIEWEGKTNVLSPIGITMASPPPGDGAAPPRPEGVPMPMPNPGAIMNTVAQSVEEQHQEEPVRPDVVMSEPPSPIQLPEQIRNVMKKMNIQNFDPSMLQNMSPEQQEEFKQMIQNEMQMQMQK